LDWFTNSISLFAYWLLPDEGVSGTLRVAKVVGVSVGGSRVGVSVGNSRMGVLVGVSVGGEDVGVSVGGTTVSVTVGVKVGMSVGITVSVAVGISVGGATGLSTSHFGLGRPAGLIKHNQAQGIRAIRNLSRIENAQNSLLYELVDRPMNEDKG
jgi:hypothetical protein